MPITEATMFIPSNSMHDAAAPVPFACWYCLHSGYSGATFEIHSALATGNDERENIGLEKNDYVVADRIFVGGRFLFSLCWFDDFTC